MRGIFSICLAAVSLLVGCGPLVELPGQNGVAPVYYELTPSQDTLTAAGIPWTIYIEEPSMAQSLRRERIAVKPDRDRLEYLADAQWSDRVPDLIRRFVAESLESSGHVNAIAAESLDLPTEYRLRMDVRDFEAAYYPDPQRPDVNIRFAVMLVRTAPVEIVASQTFSTSVAARDGEAVSVVAAFNQAMNRVTQDMAGWIAGLKAGS